jgi:FkbH-like protein
MIDSTLANKKICKRGEIVNDIPPFIIRKYSLLDWEEHCVECSVPYCYHNCPLYKERKDKKCVRLENGIQRNDNYKGSMPYGITCEFRKWAKLETFFTGICVSKSINRIISSVNDFLGCFSGFLASMFSFKEPHLNFYGRYTYYKYVLHRKVFAKHNWKPNVFYVKCYLENKDEINFLIQIDKENEIKYTKIFKLEKGVNEISIPINGELDGDVNYRVFVTPLEETNTIITFTWIDFLEVYKTGKAVKHAKKVKLVAWDLDNTLWYGTLVENENVQINKEAIDTIKELDRRGIINVVLSKNNYEQALSKLKEFNIDKYFVSFAINWGQKSENLKSVGERLNLGLDSFAFIDDNVREREDMSVALPEVRIYDEKEISTLLIYDEFNVPITEESSKRRLSYQNEENRQEYKANFSKNYDEFLRNLKMELSVLPINKDNRDRCYELLSRTNQLNLSTNRYTNEEYNALLENKENLCVAFKCKDKFGGYGIISFLSMHIKGDCAEILDFVISCRIAKKKVEETIVYSLKPLLLGKGIKSMEACLIKTSKNKPIEDVFNCLPFVIKENNDKFIVYYMKDINTIKEQDIIQILYEL